MSTPATQRAAGESPSASIGDFDHHADTYREDVAKAIAWSGRDVDYFAEGKAELLVSLAARRLGDPSGLRALDVGCGIGVTDRFLVGRFAELHGIDLAADAIEQARAANPTVDYRPYEGGHMPFEDDAVDVAFTICVLHHVPPAEWAAFAREMRRVVRPGGLVVVFEHNPLNPLTRVSVSRCPFDEDVTLLRADATERLLCEVGLREPERRFFFFLPLRKIAESRLEHALRRVPLGAQYYVAATA
ncbi:MAG: class I SAM-dependent methyltransferase [Actinomycetota bacterium]|nr:class I SAM-dependent methyltransferase [Actinomycetota bacterium]